MGRRKKIVSKKSSSLKPSLRFTLPLLIVLFLIITFITRFNGENTVPAQAQNNSVTTPQPTVESELVEETQQTIEPTTSYNRHPRINTVRLPTGTVGVPYKAVLIGVDNDTNESLTQTITGLPNNILYDCASAVKNNVQVMECTLSGTPTYVFTTDSLLFSLTDSRGNTVSNRYTFIVNAAPTPTFAPTPTSAF